MHVLLPRIEIGMPTVCSETCVGRMRYLGVMLYDADKVAEAASVEDEHDLYPAQVDCFLDPDDPAVITAARAAGITDEWLDAARRSPVYDLIATYQVALPLHPEYRTMPMVWYVPPLSPVVEAVAATGSDGEDAGNLFGAIDAMRIPVEYLAAILTAGDTVPVEAVLRRMAAMRSHMRRINLGEPREEAIAEAVGLTGREMEDLFRLLAVAKQEDRFVVPSAARAEADALAASHPTAPVDRDCPVAEHPSEPRVMLNLGSTRRSS